MILVDQHISTLEGLKKGAKIPVHIQQLLSHYAFCAKCRVTTIVDYSIQNDRFGLVLQGHCNKCGGSVARFVENNELVSAANQLKLTAADGKKYRTDTFDYDGIIELAKNFPGKQANRFIEWFSYSDETIDGAFFA